MPTAIGYIFGLAGNSTLDKEVAEISDHLRFWHAWSTEAKLRCYTSFEHRVGRWSGRRAASSRASRHRCILIRRRRPDAMRQEIDVRYVVTSLDGDAERIYEGVYCQRGQAENLIKLHKAQLASDRTSCHSAIANQVRLMLHTAAFWLMHTVRAAIPAGARARESRVQYASPAPHEDRGPRRRIRAAESACICRPVASRKHCSATSPSASRHRDDVRGTTPRPSRRTRHLNPKRVAPRVTATATTGWPRTLRPSDQAASMAA